MKLNVLTYLIVWKADLPQEGQVLAADPTDCQMGTADDQNEMDGKVDALQEISHLWFLMCCLAACHKNNLCKTL